MNEKVRNFCVGGLFVLFFLIGVLFCLFVSPKSDSTSERRPLAQFPSLTAGAVLDTSFMTDFEDYSLDQFPFRDTVRQFKAFLHYKVFRRPDNNGIYLVGSTVSKLEYPLSGSAVTYAADKFASLYDTYFAACGATPYYAVIPDKNYFLAEPNGYPALDYGQLQAIMDEKLAAFHKINLFDVLSIDDYYRTDTHWRQECLAPVADRIGTEMGFTPLSPADCRPESFSPFYGVYSGQAALPIAPDTMVYLNHETLGGCTVYNYETDKTGGIYDLERLNGKDPYEMFLSGSAALLTIENPSAESDRTLVVFRDSFGSSLIPLLTPGYAKITVVDIRYVTSDYLGTLLDFSDTDDVLFLYSTLVLNQSTMLK